MQLQDVFVPREIMITYFCTPMGLSELKLDKLSRMNVILGEILMILRKFVLARPLPHWAPRMRQIEGFVAQDSLNNMYELSSHDSKRRFVATNHRNHNYM